MTFLFTDIEGSTRRWESDADAMRAALLKHDDVLRTAIEKHEGFLFSHTGDGVVAAFASPRSAVDAAIAAQRALELPVGMGIATGEAELRGGDYFGTVLNRAARVMAARSGPPAHRVRLGLHQELIRQFPLIDRIRRGHGIHRGRHDHAFPPRSARRVGQIPINR